MWQVGEEIVIDEESGNRTIVPIMMNVTTISYESCRVNRSSACLATCSEVGYLVCVPETDPFDLCVQSCAAQPPTLSQPEPQPKKRVHLSADTLYPPTHPDHPAGAWPTSPTWSQHTSSTLRSLYARRSLG